MYTLKTLLVVVVVLLCTAQTTFAGGLDVSDGGSYIYQAKQIEQMVKQIEEIKAQTIGQFARLESIKDQVSGQFEGITKLYDTLKSVKSDFESKVSSLSAEAMKWTKLKDQIQTFTGLPNSLSKIVQASLGDIFIDPRKISKDAVKYLNRQYNLRQTALQKTIAATEDILLSVPKKLEAIDMLEAAAQKAGSQKAAQDITNALLLQILRTLTTYLAAINQFNQASSLMSFTGLDEDVMKKREKDIWSIQKAVTDTSKGITTPYDDVMRSGGMRYGLDSKDPGSMKNMQDRFNKAFKL